jgi:uncharacterized RDD family membrane protein YckC
MVSLAILVAGTGWLLQQFLGIDTSHCPPATAWWHLRAHLCNYMPYVIPAAGVIIPPAYRILFFVIAGQTPGMAVMGLRLRRSDGRKVGLRQAAKRVLTFYATFGLGSVLIPVTARRRALHDIVAGTVVIHDWGDHALDFQRALEQLQSTEP